jgi:uncharacterized protein
MERIILSGLRAWKAKARRKPLLLTGPRQVGKTYALKAFGKTEYARAHYLNFEEEPGLLATFEKDLKPSRILAELGFHLGITINPSRDLLIFDEIQAAPKALTSLKYFAEELPELSVCGAGSLLGLHLGAESFPVGKVEFLPVHPMTFEEFLRGTGEEQAAGFLEEYDFGSPVPELIHVRLWDLLKTYFAVGGMPEPVLAYNALKDDPFSALEAVRKSQQDLITAYGADVAKHSGKVNSMHIERVWRNVPAQLARSQEGSSSKFKFQDVVPGVRGYARLAGAIDWLQSAGLVLKVPLVNKAWLPLRAHVAENAFKLYMPDTGLLGALGGLSPKILLDYSFGSYKGYVAENFALQEMTAAHAGDVVCWRENTAEVEFLLESNGALLPVEVKSGGVTKAQSLRVFADKYHPPVRVILCAGNYSRDPARGVARVPLYLASRIPRLGAAG